MTANSNTMEEEGRRTMEELREHALNEVGLQPGLGCQSVGKNSLSKGETLSYHDQQRVPSD